MDAPRYSATLPATPERAARSLWPALTEAQAEYTIVTLCRCQTVAQTARAMVLADDLRTRGAAVVRGVDFARIDPPTAHQESTP